MYMCVHCNVLSPSITKNKRTLRGAGNKRPVYRFRNIIKIYYVSLRRTVRTPALKPKQRNTTHCVCTTTCGRVKNRERYTACETRNILIGLVKLINFSCFPFSTKNYDPVLVDEHTCLNFLGISSKTQQKNYKNFY
jgi:hypothetical protein